MIFSYYYYYSPLTLHSIPARYSTLCLTSAILVIYVSKLILPPPPPRPRRSFASLPSPFFFLFSSQAYLITNIIFIHGLLYSFTIILLLLHLPGFQLRKVLHLPGFQLRKVLHLPGFQLRKVLHLPEFQLRRWLHLPKFQ